MMSEQKSTRSLEFSHAFVMYNGVHCLVFETSKESPWYGKWVPPAERVGMDETPEYAAIRAMDGKAGLAGEITSDPYTKERTRRGRLVTLHYFSAKLIDEISSGGLERRWFTSDEIRTRRGVASYVPQVMEKMGLLQ